MGRLEVREHIMENLDYKEILQSFAGTSCLRLHSQMQGPGLDSWSGN